MQVKYMWDVLFELNLFPFLCLKFVYHCLFLMFKHICCYIFFNFPFTGYLKMMLVIFEVQPANAAVISMALSVNYFFLL